MQPAAESQAMLRVRIDILQRRVRILEDEQSQVVNEIERIQEEGGQSLSLRRMEQENDTRLLDQLQQLTRLQRHLRQLEESMASDDHEDVEEINTAERRKNAEKFLFFQKMVFDENGRPPINEAIKERSFDDQREYREGFGTLPISECAICLDAYKAREIIGWPKDQRCPHLFHADCILTWLSQSDYCPLCRKAVVWSEEDSKGSR